MTTKTHLSEFGISKKLHQIVSPETIARIPEMPAFLYSHEAPSLADIMYGNDYPIKLSQRNNRIQYKKDENSPVQTVTEGEALEDLIERLNAYYGATQVMWEFGTGETIAEMIRPLKFIGDYELQTGVKGLATRLAHYAGNYDLIPIYLPDNRSDKYITLLVLEELAKYDVENELLKKIHPASLEILGRETIEAVQAGARVKILALDDHVISGMQGSEFLGKLFSALLEQGMSVEQIQEMVEADYISARKPEGEEDPFYLYRARPYGEEQGYVPFNVYSYYATKPAVIGGGEKIGPICTSHCLPDFSVDNPLSLVIRRLNKKLGGVMEPKIKMIVKPYETDQKGKFLDPDLQRRWEEIIKRTRV